MTEHLAASAHVVDARGLSCPEPAMLARQALQAAGSGAVTVLVDSASSRDNVIRTAKLAGWKAEVLEEAGGVFRLTLTR